MHTCLTLKDIDGHGYVERGVFGLVERLDEYCGSIRSCEISVEGPGDPAVQQHWRIDLKLGLFGRTVHVTARRPAGDDAAQSFARVLDDIYARATAQLAHIAKQHLGCCAYHASAVAADTEASA
jgi:hypothetical protein